MSALATDNFDRADNADSGANWTPNNDSFRVLTNAAAPRSFGSDAAERYSAITWPNNQYSQAVLTTTANDAEAGIGVAVRMDTGNANTLYRVIVNTNGSNNWAISKFVTGAHTSLGNFTSAWTNGHIAYLEIQGSTIKAKYDGAQVGGDFTDAAIGSGAAGIAFSSGNSSTNTLDDWEGGDFIQPAITIKNLTGMRPRLFAPGTAR